MKVLLTSEWKVQKKPYHGMLKLRSLTENMYLLCDIVKLHDKERKMSFIYQVTDGKVQKHRAHSNRRPTL